LLGARACSGKTICPLGRAWLTCIQSAANGWIVSIAEVPDFRCKRAPHG